MSTEHPKTAAEMHAQMRAMVEYVIGIFSDPWAWPLTDEDRVRFLRTQYLQAKRIAESEPFLAEGVRLAAERLAKHEAVCEKILAGSQENEQPRRKRK